MIHITIVVECEIIRNIELCQCLLYSSFLFYRRKIGTNHAKIIIVRTEISKWNQMHPSSNSFDTIVRRIIKLSCTDFFWIFLLDIFSCSDIHRHMFPKSWYTHIGKCPVTTREEDISWKYRWKNTINMFFCDHSCISSRKINRRHKHTNSP